MRKYFHRFVALVLVPALILADPAWAALPPRSLALTPPAPANASPYAYQAITPRSLMPGPGTQEIWKNPNLPNRSRRTFLRNILQAAGATALLSPFAAPFIAMATNTPKEQDPNAKIVIQAAEIKKENIALTQAQFQAAIHSPFDIRQANQSQNLLRLVMRQNPTTWANFFDHRAAWEKLIAMIESDDKYLGGHLDPLHSMGLGNRPLVRDALFINSLTVNRPLRQWETADSPAPGGGFWRQTLVHLRSAFDHIWGGVQWKSKSIVQETWLQVYGQAFTVHKTFKGFLGAAQDLYQESDAAWLEYHRQRLTIRELERKETLLARAASREVHAASANAEADPETALTLQTERETARLELQTAIRTRDSIRNKLAKTLVPDQDQLTADDWSFFDPAIPSMTIDRERMRWAERVADVLKAEGANVRPIKLTPPPSEQAYRAALAAHFSAKPDSFNSTTDLFGPGGEAAFFELFKDFDLPLPDGEAVSPPVANSDNQISGSPLALPALHDLLTPLDARTELAPSPKARLLRLQMDMLWEVREKTLDLQKKTKLQAGVHLDLATFPLLAELFNFDIQKPTRSTLFSLDDLKKEADFQIQSMENQIAAEEIRVRAEFIEARNKRQAALQAFRSTVNQIALQMKALNIALRTNTRDQEVNFITPFLNIQMLRITAEKHLVEAMQAQRAAVFYTVPVQKEIEDEFNAFNLEIAQKLDPKATLKPEDLNPPLPKRSSAPPSLGKWIPSAVKGVVALAVGLIVPALAHAQSYVINPISASATSLHQAVTRFSVDVTLGHYHSGHSQNTLWGIARDILRSHNPQHKPSLQAIHAMVNKIAQANGSLDPRHIQAGKVLHLGQYDTGVMQHLVNHHHASVAALPPAAPAIPAPTLAAYHPLPTPHSPVHEVISQISSTHGPTGWHGLQHLMDWMVISPWHFAIVSVAVLAILSSFLFIVGHRRSANGNGAGHYPRVSAPGMRFVPTWLVTGFVMLAYLLYAGPGLVSLKLFHLTQITQSPFFAAGAIALFATLLKVAMPRLSRLPLWKWGFPLAIAAATAWILMPVVHFWALPLAAVTWLLFHLYWNHGARNPLNLLGKLTHDYRGVIGLVAAAVLLIIPAYLGPLSQRIQNIAKARAAILRKTETHAPNFGVSPKTIRLPVNWMAPPGERGVVTRVQRDRIDIAAGDLLIAYAPIDERIFQHLLEVNTKSDMMHGGDLISEAAIKTAGIEHPDAFITIQTSMPEGSVDYLINELLIELDQSLIDYRRTLAQAKTSELIDDEDNPTTRIPSLQVERARLHLRELGIRMNSLLAKRRERLITATRGFHIFPGSGIITEGTTVSDHDMTRLFDQELENDRFLQLRVTPEDAVAFLTEQRDPNSQAVIRLRAQQGSEVKTIHLSAIKEVIQPDDPGFHDLMASSDFNGPSVNSPAMGIAKTIKINLVVGQRLPEVPYFFEGIFDASGRRLLGDASGLAIGEITLAQNIVSAPPHTFGLAPLQEHLAGIRDLMAGEKALMEKVGHYRQRFPEKSWAVNFQHESEKTLKRLESVEQTLQATIDAMEKEGARGNVQAKFPYREEHYVFNHAIPNMLAEEGILLLSPEGQATVRLTVSANSSTLAPGSLLSIQTLPGAPPINFRVIALESQDRNNDLNLYTCEATLPLAEARKLFPAAKPMTNAYVLVPLSVGTASHLTRTELSHAGVWVAALGVLGYITGHTDLVYWVLGLVSAVGIHEILGHGWRAWRQGRRASLRWSWKDGFRWFEQTAEGVSRILHDRIVQAAGPAASEWSIRMVLLLAVIPLLFFPGGHVMAFGMAILVGSLIFRGADRPMKPSTNTISEDFPLQQTVSPAFVDSLEYHGQHNTRIPLAGIEREALRKMLKDTTLEYESYFYPGQRTTYLSWHQAPLLLLFRKIKLTARMIFMRRFQRDNLHWIEALILASKYKSKQEEAKAGAKTRTFLWVLLLGTVTSIYLVGFAPPPVLETVHNLIFANPMLQALQGTGDLLPKLTLIITSFIGGWIIIAAAEAWGKFIATTPWNIRFILLFITGLPMNVEQWFNESTGKDAMERFKKIEENRILHPGTKEYDDFIDLFTRFAGDMTDKVYAVFEDEDPEKPSKEAQAFANAFRIQIRRSGMSKAPIYQGLAPELADDATLIAFLRKEFAKNVHPIKYDAYNDTQQYWLLQCARVHEAERRADDYPVHTLMALIRSGTAELILDLYWQKHKDSGDQQAQEKQILEELKERASTLDPDVFDGLRAQDRFDEFADMLHYAFKALTESVEAQDTNLRRRVLGFLEAAVTAPERPTWDLFNSELDRLVIKARKDERLAESDRNIVQSIVYVLALRRLKEDSRASLNFLRGLRSIKSDPPSVTIAHRYLRDAVGQPTTSILKLNMTYQKYYDLITELIDTFPHAALFGKSNIYITLNNTIGLRQILREVDYYLRFSRGEIFILDDIGRTHKTFAGILEQNLRDRLPWKDLRRVHVSTVTQERGQLATDRSAIIFSSGIPLDAQILARSAGTFIQLPSPLLNPAAALLVLRSHQSLETDFLFDYTRQALASRFARLQGTWARLKTIHQKRNKYVSWLGNELFKIAMLPPNEKDRWQEAQLAVAYYGLKPIEKFDLWRLRRATKRRDAVLRQWQALQDLHREINDVGRYLATIGVPPTEYRPDEPLPLIDPDKVLPGEFTLDFFIRHVQKDATPSPSSPISHDHARRASA